MQIQTYTFHTISSIHSYSIQHLVIHIQFPPDLVRPLHCRYRRGGEQLHSMKTCTSSSLRSGNGDSCAMNSIEIARSYLERLQFFQKSNKWHPHSPQKRRPRSSRVVDLVSFKQQSILTLLITSRHQPRLCQTLALQEVQRRRCGPRSPPRS